MQPYIQMPTPQVVILTKEELTELLNNQVKQVVDELKKTMFNSHKEYLTLKETTQFFNVQPNTIRKWTRENRFTQYNIGGKVYFKYDELVKAIEKTK